MKTKLNLFLIFLLCLVSFNFAVTNISSCQTINAAGAYALNASFTSTSSPCINITADNVSLVGAGFNITAITATAPSYTFNITGMNDSISGLLISAGSNMGGGGSNGTLSAAFLNSGTNTQLINDTAFGDTQITGTFGGSVLSSSGNNITMMQDYFVGGTAVATLGGYGVMTTGTNGTIFNNTILGGNSSLAGQQAGVAFSQTNGGNLIIDDNIIHAGNSSVVNYDISITGGVVSDTIFNNDFDGNSGVTATNNNLWNTSINCSSPNIIGGKCIGGNFYSNYTGFTYGSGIGTTPYSISTMGTDFAPLTNNFTTNNITGCTVITSPAPEQLQFNQSITYNITSGNCILINGSNILLNGNNFLFYNNATSLLNTVYGITEIGETNITLNQINASNLGLLGDYNIYFNSGGNNIVQNSYVVNGSNLTGGVEFASETNATFINNICFTPNSDDVNSCVEFSNVNGGLIQNNSMTNSGSHNGIYVLNSNNTLINRNTLFNMSSLDSGHGIRVSGPNSWGDNITNNYINYTDNTCILTENDPGNMTIVNNTCANIQTDGIDITLKGTNTIANNTMSNTTRVDYRPLLDLPDCPNITFTNNIATGGQLWYWNNSNNVILGNQTIPGATLCGVTNATVSNISIHNTIISGINEFDVIDSSGVFINQLNSNFTYLGIDIVQGAQGSTPCNATISNSNLNNTIDAGIATYDNCNVVIQNVSSSNSPSGLYADTNVSINITGMLAVNNSIYGIAFFLNPNSVSISNSTIYSSGNSIENFLNSNANSQSFQLSNVQIGNDSNMDMNANVSMMAKLKTNDSFILNYPFFPLPSPPLGMGWSGAGYANLTVNSGAPNISGFGFNYLSSNVNPPSPSTLAIESLPSFPPTWVINPTTSIPAQNLIFAQNFNSSQLFTAGIQNNCPIINVSGTYVQNQTLYDSPNTAFPESGGSCVYINSSNVIYNCNDSSIINSAAFLMGGGSTGILIASPSSEFTNITIENCNISNYDYDIRINTGSDLNLINNTLSNSSRAGIEADATQFSNISGNYFLNITFMNPFGLLLDMNSNNDSVSNNVANNMNGSAFSFDNSTANMTSFNNNAFNTTQAPFDFESQSLISINDSSNISGEGISIQGSNDQIINCTSSQAMSSHGISAGITLGGSNNIVNGCNASNNGLLGLVISGNNNILENSYFSFNNPTAFNPGLPITPGGIATAPTMGPAPNNMTLLNNIMFSNPTGFASINSTNITMINNTIDNSSVGGIYLVGSGISASDDHLFNNNESFYVNAPSFVQILLNNEIFDEGSGDYENLTNLSVSNAQSNIAYSINWSASPTPMPFYPANISSVNNTFVNITSYTGSPVFSNLQINWNSAESTNDTQFQILNYNGSVYLAPNQTLNAPAMFISITNASVGNYGLYLNTSIVPPPPPPSGPSSGYSLPLIPTNSSEVSNTTTSNISVSGPPNSSISPPNGIFDFIFQSPDLCIPIAVIVGILFIVLWRRK